MRFVYIIVGAGSAGCGPRPDRVGASARAATCRAGGVAALSGVRPTWADGARGLSTGRNTVGGRGGRGRRGPDPFPGRRTP